MSTHPLPGAYLVIMSSIAGWSICSCLPATKSESWHGPLDARRGGWVWMASTTRICSPASIRRDLWRQPISPVFSPKPLFPGKRALHEIGRASGTFLWSLRRVCPAIQSESFALRHCGCQSQPSTSAGKSVKISAWWQTIKLETLRYSQQHSGWEWKEPLVDCGERWLAAAERTDSLGSLGTCRAAVCFGDDRASGNRVQASSESVGPSAAGRDLYSSSVPWRKGGTSLAQRHPASLSQPSSAL